MQINAFGYVVEVTIRNNKLVEPFLRMGVPYNQCRMIKAVKIIREQLHVELKVAKCDIVDKATYGDGIKLSPMRREVAENIQTQLEVANTGYVLTF